MKMLFLLPYLPYKEVPHAGGRVIFNLINTFGKKHEIYGISFINSRQEKKKIKEANKSFCRFDWVSLPWFMKVFNFILLFFAPLRFSIRCSLVFLYKISLLRKEKIDVVIIDHSIMGMYVFFIRLLFPKACIIWNMVELSSLAILREIKLSRSFNKVFFTFEYLKSIFWEKLIGQTCDFIFTFSSKEEESLINLGFSKNIIIIIQPDTYSLIKENEKIDFYRDRAGIIFFGKMDRKENWEAVLYFIREVFPIVKSDCPYAHLFIVGANPHIKLLREAKKNKDIFVTGYVRNIKEVLSQVKVAVFPLRLGAGIRFKVLDALSWGIPVVTTSIGKEGIPHQSEVIKEANSPQEISREVLHFLRMDDEKISNLSLEAKRFVKLKYNWEQNCENIEKIMREFCESR